ncbi:MAG: SAM hydroxide adenosyltransferase, partial [Pseudomonadota bacterium]
STSWTAQAVTSACAVNDVDVFNIDVGAIAGMDTVIAGFKTAQLAMNSKLGFGHIIHTNCAPRKNIISTESKGEGVVLGMLPNGVCLLTVSSGYSLAPFYKMIAAGEVQFFQTRIPDAGSQFRSRDYFPDATARLARYLQDITVRKGANAIQDIIDSGKGHELLADFEYIGEPVDESWFNELPEGGIWYIDNFGNIKLNIPHEELVEQYDPGSALMVAINDTIVDAVVGTAGFSQGEGILALTRGSSGWSKTDQEVRFTEIFLRGGSAAKMFSNIKPGVQVQIISRKDLYRCVEQIRNSGLKKLATLDLYLFSEAKLIELLAIEGLIEDGFKTDKLRAALDAGTLVDQIK